MANESSVFKDVCSPGSYNASLGLNGTAQNSSRNSGSSALCWSLSFDARIGLVCMYALIVFFGVPGNFVVCYVLGKHSNSKLSLQWHICAWVLYFSSIEIGSIFSTAYLVLLFVSNQGNECKPPIIKILTQCFLLSNARCRMALAHLPNDLKVVGLNQRPVKQAP